MPFPPTFEALEAAGYRSLRMEVCPDCHLSIEVYRTPAKREIAFQPMCNLLAVPVPHYQVCKPEPLPASKADLGKSGWKTQGSVQCYECKRAIEGWIDPQGEPVKLECMMGDDWPVVLHKCRLVQSRTSPQNESGGTEGPPEGKREQEGAIPGQQQAFKMYGVSGKNVLAAGYDAERGTLRIRFPQATWDYFQVPEEKFVSIRRTPYADKFFTTSIRGKFNGKKVA